MNNQSKNLLKVNNINKDFLDFNLQNINFNINRGDIIGLIGENGAGKSTLIKTLLNITNSSKGTVYWENKDIKANEISYKQKIYTIFDTPLLIEFFEYSNIKTFFKLMYNSFSENVFDYYYNLFELPHNRRISNFSHGMKVKLNFAIGFSINPDIFFLDEATSGLDPFSRKDILNLLECNVIKNKSAAFLSSHIIGDIERICTRIILIKNGAIIFDENKKMIYKKYEILIVDDLTKIDKLKFEVIKFIRTPYDIKVLVEKRKPSENINNKLSLEDFIHIFIKGDDCF